MLVSDFNYELPPESIAQEPLTDRAGSRMLHLVRDIDSDKRGNFAAVSGGAWQDCKFRDFSELLRPDDLLVLNNTRVFPARLYGRRSGERALPVSAQNPAARDFLRGRVEVLLTRQVSADPNEWDCLVHPGRKIGVGERLYFRAADAGGVQGNDREAQGRPAIEESNPPPTHDAVELEAQVISRGSFGERRIRFRPVADFFARMERIGHVPLPPYIDREDDSADRERYQTVYAKTRGSVAAPTAGLHFTPEILGRIRGRGIEIAEITLHVGLGTFQPVRVEKVEDHRLHQESYEISRAAADAINRAKAAGRRVVAIGTTTVRTLEFAAQQGSGVDESKRKGISDDDASRNGSGDRAEGQVQPGRGEADIFIYPGYRFQIVDALLTNFHLPQSTLLMLVCAFAGRELVLRAYRHAVESGYRFYSYGDCMFVE